MRGIAIAVSILAACVLPLPAYCQSVTTNWSLVLHSTTEVSLQTILTTINSNYQTLDTALLTPAQKTAVVNLITSIDPITGDNSETLDNQTDDLRCFTGVGGADNTDFCIDLDGTWPRFYSPTDAAMQFDGVQYLARLIVNDAGADVDSRIEGTTDANLFYVDAGTDRIGIGTATPGQKLSVVGDFSISSGSVSYFLRGLTNEPAMRVNTSSNELEYRDEDSPSWVPLDSLAGGLTNGFETWDAPAGTDPVADIATDVMVLTATGLTITGADNPESLAFAIAADGVNDTHIDWGTGANQVSADDVPDGSTDGIPTLAQIALIHTQNTDTQTNAVAFTVGEGTGDGGNEALMFDEALTNEPGVRVNSTTNQVEYRDQDSATWTALDNLAVGADQLDFVEFKDVMGVDVATKIGDAANFTQIETDGEIGAFGGTARPAKVLLLRADAFDNIHANVIRGAAGGFTNYPPQTFEFADANDMAVNYARLGFFMPEDFDATADCQVEIHAFSDTANAGAATVRIQLKSLTRGNSDPLDTALGSAVAFNVTPDAAAKDLLIHTQTYADGFVAGQLCIFEIARDGDDATNDTFTGSLEVTQVILRYWRSKLSQE